MHTIVLFFHLAAAIFWMGGMAFMLLALRPSLGQLAPPQRLPLLAEVLARFFRVVGLSVAVLLLTGLGIFAMARGTPVPSGWHAMAGLGLTMMLIFGHVFFSTWRKMQRAVAAADWTEAGKRAGQIATTAKVNLALGWLAIAAVMLWR